MRQRLAWDIAKGETSTRVAFRGDIDEASELETLAASLSGALVFDVSGVRRINSAGVGKWSRFVASLDPAKKVAFERCPPAFVRQIAVVAGFAGGAEVRSVLAPYVCKGCEREAELCVEAGAHAVPPEVACSGCGGQMEFDDVEKLYLSVLGSRSGI